MATLDTNVLVRWLTHDNAKQSRAAGRLFGAMWTFDERAARLDGARLVEG